MFQYGMLHKLLKFYDQVHAIHFGTFPVFFHIDYPYDLYVLSAVRACRCLTYYAYLQVYSQDIMVQCMQKSWLATQLTSLM